MISEQEIETIKENLSAAMVWCASKFPVANPAPSFRTPALQINLPQLVEPVEVVKAVQEVVKRRAGLIKELRLENNLKPGYQGKLLTCKIHLSLFDTSAESITDGFIDQFDRPPCDTWVYAANPAKPPRPMDEGSSCLFAWIPISLVSLVQRAVGSNADGALAWVTDLPTDTDMDLIRAIKSKQ